MKKLDLTGQVFGRLTAVYRDEESPRPKWFCQCSCGGSAKVALDKLRSGHTKSCGCIQAEHPNHTKHGQASKAGRTAEYGTWAAMKSRCTNPNVKNFARYGGRGIRVASEFESFEAFIAHIGPRPTAAHTIERIDNDGNYEPGNVRWATRKEQAANRGGKFAKTT